MAGYNDLEKAKENINEIFRRRDEYIKASPILNVIKANIEWYQKVCKEIPEKEDSILQNIDVPIQIVLTLAPSNFNVYDASGATGSFYSVSGHTITIIQSFGSEHYNLINEYDEINKTDDLIILILKELLNLWPELQEVSLYDLLFEAKETYAKWKAYSVSNSDLAKDIRAFQDIFNGTLHRARVHTYTPIPKEYPDPSWPKMVDALARKGSRCNKTLKEMQGAEMSLHLAFTEIMKKTKEVNKLEMDRLFKTYIEHIYAIISMIDMDILNLKK